MHFRVWAPTHERITLVVEAPEPRELVLEPEAGGYHSVFAPGLAAGARYRFRIGDQLLADPASRFQPEGPLGPSQVIDPAGFPWTDAGWRGIAADRHVIYELHVGTFTPAGTWTSAAAELAFLADLGITTLEVMPVADFGGRRNWGYDGVNLFAPTRNYGTPDDFRRFVDQAHGLGLAVILDVVYNHFGPVGSPLVAFCPHYRAKKPTDWGDAVDFDGPNSAGVREYFIANAAYWIDEFRLDGLRLDALQSMDDTSPRHVIEAIVQRARLAAPDRQIFIVGEDEPQDVQMLEYGVDALWNDDFHHTSRVAIAGHVDGYLHDYGGTPQEFVSAVRHGFLYQGQLYPWQRAGRGTPTRGFARHRFVHFLENHDQSANLGFGERLVEAGDRSITRALTAVLLLGPETPMLFQGQETGSRRPWRFFVDHDQCLGTAVRDGRAEFLAQFDRLATPEAQARLVDPCLEAAFTDCILDPAERTFENPWVRLHRDLLAMRQNDPAFAGDVDGAVLSPHAFCLRFAEEGGDDRLVLVNLGPTFLRDSVPEPLIAPPRGLRWRLEWSSEHPRYGGHGTPRVFTGKRLAIPARAAVVLAPTDEEHS